MRSGQGRGGGGRGGEQDGVGGVCIRAKSALTKKAYSLFEDV